MNGGFDWVRESLYQPFFCDEGTSTKPNNKTTEENRARIDAYLDAYDKSGVSLLLAPMYGKADDPGLPSFARWIGEISNRHPCVRVIELHNEPNLKGFWAGTPCEFVAASNAFAAQIRKVSPNAKIVVGSFAGWGAAWDREDLKELVKGPKEISTLWAEKAFEAGLLKIADGISAHPYRGAAAPEGGDVNEDPLDAEGFEKEIREWMDLPKKFPGGEKPLPFFITEIGYSVSETEGYSKVKDEARQADYLSRVMLLLLNARLAGVPLDGVFWYDLKQDENDYVYEANFGLVSPDTARLRPGYLTYRRIAEAFPNVDDLAKVDLPREFTNHAEKIKSYVWKGQADRTVSIAFWRLNQIQSKDEDFASEVIFPVPEGVKVASVQLVDLHEDRPRLVGYRVDDDGKLHIPLWVTARAAWITLSSNAELPPSAR